MSNVQSYKEYMDALLCHGHSNKEWNPKMAPYILSEKKGYHILDLIKTKYLLETAGNFLKENANAGKKILFVGTSKESSSLIKDYALKSNSFFVNFRWLGGTLTNWITLQKRIEHLNSLEKLLSTNEFKTFSKKDQMKLKKDFNNLIKLFGGIQKMSTPPDCVIFTDHKKDILGIHECLKVGIPAVSIVDTDCDPTLVPYPIPSNNKSSASISFILNYLVNRIKIF